MLCRLTRSARKEVAFRAFDERQASFAAQTQEIRHDCFLGIEIALRPDHLIGRHEQRYQEEKAEPAGKHCADSSADAFRRLYELVHGCAKPRKISRIGFSVGWFTSSTAAHFLYPQ